MWVMMAKRKQVWQTTFHNQALSFPKLTDAFGQDWQETCSLNDRPTGKFCGESPKSFNGGGGVGHPPGVRKYRQSIDVDMLGLYQLHQALPAVSAAATRILESSPWR